MFWLNLYKNKEMREAYKTYQKRKILKKERAKSHNQTFEHLLPSVSCFFFLFFIFLLFFLFVFFFFFPFQLQLLLSCFLHFHFLPDGKNARIVAGRQQSHAAGCQLGFGDRVHQQTIPERHDCEQI